jgi:hypothetical protein
MRTFTFVQQSIDVLTWTREIEAETLEQANEIFEMQYGREYDLDGLEHKSNTVMLDNWEHVEDEEGNTIVPDIDEYDLKGIEHLKDVLKDGFNDSHEAQFIAGIQYALEQLDLT